MRRRVLFVVASATGKCSFLFLHGLPVSLVFLDAAFRHALQRRVGVLRLHEGCMLALKDAQGHLVDPPSAAGSRPSAT